MHVLWRPCNRSAFCKVMGSEASWVHSDREARYIMFAAPLYRMYLGIIPAKAERHLVHMLFDDDKAFDAALAHLLRGASSPCHDWQFAKFKVIKQGLGEVHRVFLVKHTSREFEAQRQAADLVQAVASCSDFDMESWSALVHAICPRQYGAAKYTPWARKHTFIRDSVDSAISHFSDHLSPGHPGASAAGI